MFQQNLKELSYLEEHNIWLSKYFTSHVEALILSQRGMNHWMFAVIYIQIRFKTCSTDTYF